MGITPRRRWSRALSPRLNHDWPRYSFRERRRCGTKSASTEAWGEMLREASPEQKRMPAPRCWQYAASQPFPSPETHAADQSRAPASVVVIGRLGRQKEKGSMETRELASF
jgi:hypothetical protein